MVPDHASLMEIDLTLLANRTDGRLRLARVDNLDPRV